MNFFSTFFPGPVVFDLPMVASRPRSVRSNVAGRSPVVQSHRMAVHSFVNRTHVATHHGVGIGLRARSGLGTAPGVLRRPRGKEEDDKDRHPGYYVPPGYELVSTRELDDLRSGALGAATPTVDPAAAARLKEREENIWMKRVEPRVRQAPTPTARPQAVSAPRTPAATPRTSSASSTPASKSTGAKKSASPPKKRRR